MIMTLDPLHYLARLRYLFSKDEYVVRILNENKLIDDDKIRGDFLRTKVRLAGPAFLKKNDTILKDSNGDKEWEQ